MATYKEVKGVTIQTLDADPVENVGSWSSGGSMNTARTAKQGSGTGSDNAIVAGGYLATASPARQTACEVYNGTAWTEVAEANTARMFGQGGGTSTAAIISGGDTTATPPYQGITETWNGSSWTEVADMNTGRVGHFLTGVTTAAIVGGAYPASTSVESWNGSSWTEASYDLNTAKTYMWGTGTSTAAIVSGFPNTVEQFNGSNWTEVAETNTDHREGGSGGISTDALVWGGEPGYTVNTELWDNSSWTEQSNLSTGRSYIGATENAPSTTTALAYGGSSPAQVASTEEWGFPPATQAKLKEGMVFLSAGTTLKGFGKAAGLPAGTWSSGGTLNTGRSLLGGAGNNTAGIVFGGYRPAYHAVTETYDGTTFTEVNDMNTARYNLGSASAGTQTSALGYGGSKSPSNTQTGETESWNGTSWTELNDMNVAKGQVSSIGVQTSALAAGGTNGSSMYDTNESWDGTSWTEVGDLNTVRYAFGASGVSNTSGLVFGGVPYTGSPPDGMPLTELWNGSTWTEVNDLNTGRAANAGAGTATQAICYAGNPSNPNNALTEVWNGTSWTEIADLATGRNGTSPSGSAVAGFAAGTEAAPTNTVTENFTAAAALSTVSLS